MSLISFSLAVICIIISAKVFPLSPNIFSATVCGQKLFQVLFFSKFIRKREAG